MRRRADVPLRQGAALKAAGVAALIAILTAAVWTLWPRPTSRAPDPIAPSADAGVVPIADAEPENGCVLRGRAVGATAGVVWVASPAADPVDHRLVLEDLEHTPRLLVIRRRDTIRFVNRDDTLHDLTAEPVPLTPAKTGPLGTHRFDRLGATRLRCNNHDHERVDVIVIDGAQWSSIRPDGTWRLDDVPAGPKTIGLASLSGGTQTADFDGCGAVPPLRLPPAADGRAPGP